MKLLLLSIVSLMAITAGAQTTITDWTKVKTLTSPKRSADSSLLSFQVGHFAPTNTLEVHEGNSILIYEPKTDSLVIKGDTVALIKTWARSMLGFRPTALPRDTFMSLPRNQLPQSKNK